MILDLLTYTRTHFDADYRRTLSRAATGSPLADDLNSPGKQATLLSEMTSGGFDLEGQITSEAVESAHGDTALLLLGADGYQLPDAGARRLTTTNRFELTMKKVGATWLATALSSVGLI